MDRLGDLLKSYLNTDDNDKRNSYAANDPDLTDAYDELNEFLRGGNSANPHKARDEKGPRRSSAENGQTFRPETETRKSPPEHLRADFAELGVVFGASEEVCKAARKKLLKKYHPDHYAGNEAAARDAEARTIRIIAAYDNIHKWHE
jgi:DnaJ-domain-containing protein 1